VDNRLFIKQLQLKDFRNYNELSISFSDGLNGISGLNGAGKTNILDALYYICTTRSYFNSVEQFNFRHDAVYMELSADILQSDRNYDVQFRVAKGRKKELLVNRVKEDKLTEYVGRFPVVMITPGDVEIINGGSENRRRLMDSGLCQADSVYTDTLIQYNKVLANRNALLKQFADSGRADMMLLDTVDEMLAQYGYAIYQQRLEFLKTYISRVEEVYNHLCQKKERVEVIYQSHLKNGDFLSMLKANRQKDMLLQRTTRGIHLDDLEWLLNGYPFRKTGSQGQQKSLVVSLKLALFHLLKDRKILYPVLLLDDIFEKFDQDRISRLFSWMKDIDAAQVFITDTDTERLKKMLEQTGRQYQLFRVEQANVEKI
jgi:DNA replication and repair protein RecF